jgi:hypothetical protein
MTELFLYRPHKFPWYGTMVRNYVLNRPQPKKYSHFINENTSFLLRKFPCNFAGIISQVREIIEFSLWCIINNQSCFRGQFTITDNDRLLIFGHRTIATESDQENDWRSINEEVIYIANLKCKKIVHLTHYFYGISQFLQNLHNIGAHFLIGEGNPSLFNKKIAKELESFEFHLIPFVSSKRFIKTVPFEERN